MNTSQELQAMISLLDDPDDSVFNHIKSELLTRGRPALPELEYAITRNISDTVFKNRVRDVMHTIVFDETLSELKRWMQDEKRTVMDAMLIISRNNYPNMNMDIIHSTLEEFVNYLSMEFKEYNTAYEKIDVINRLLYKDFGLSGDTQFCYALENCFINKLIERKKGNPLTMSALYMTIAQKAGLSLLGVNLPHHFILACIDAESPLGLAELQNRVLFYINPFNEGIVFGRDEIEEFLRQWNITPIPAHYKPCSTDDFIKSYIADIISICNKEGYDRKMQEYRQILGLLTSP